jgi:hypothetical protein
MTSKHTPGPWIPVAVEGGWDGVAENENRNSVICALRLNNPANARLIAAAPELLDLLGRVAYHMEGGIRMEYPASPEESPQPASEWDHEADRLAGEARRLLAKATGDA